jgi:hypothetical protein
MSEYASRIFPFAIAVLLPPAGVLVGLAAVQQERREFGLRVIVVSVLAAVVWALLILT